MNDIEFLDTIKSILVSNVQTIILYKEYFTRLKALAGESIYPYSLVSFPDQVKLKPSTVNFLLAKALNRIQEKEMTDNSTRYVVIREPGSVGENAPSKSYPTERQAEHVAESMAQRNRSTYYVAKLISRFEVVEVRKQILLDLPVEEKE